jgi:hypothetical protein
MTPSLVFPSCLMVSPGSKKYELANHHQKSNQLRWVSFMNNDGACKMELAMEANQSTGIGLIYEWWW